MLDILPHLLRYAPRRACDRTRVGERYTDVIEPPVPFSRPVPEPSSSRS